MYRTVARKRAKARKMSSLSVSSRRLYLKMSFLPRWMVPVMFLNSSLVSCTVLDEVAGVRRRRRSFVDSLTDNVHKEMENAFSTYPARRWCPHSASPVLTSSCWWPWDSQWCCCWFPPDFLWSPSWDKNTHKVDQVMSGCCWVKPCLWQSCKVVVVVGRPTARKVRITRKITPPHLTDSLCVLVS